MRICFALMAAAIFMAPHFTEAQNRRDLAVRADKQGFSSNDSWFYDDLEAAIVEAGDSKRPLMIVFR